MVTLWSILITGKDKFSYKRKGPGMYRLERTLRPDEYRETFLKAKSQYMAEHPIPWDVHFREGKCTKPQLQGWAKDFYYWKQQVPIKDYGVLCGCPDLEIRRKWVLKAVEEDGE